MYVFPLHILITKGTFEMETLTGFSLSQPSKIKHNDLKHPARGAQSHDSCKSLAKNA